MRKVVAIDEELQKKLKVEAAQKETSIYELLEKIIKEYFERGEKE